MKLFTLSGFSNSGGGPLFVGAWLGSFIARWLTMTNTKKWHDHDGTTMVSSCVKTSVFEEFLGELTNPTFLMH